MAVTAFLNQHYSLGDLKEFWRMFCDGITCGKGNPLVKGDGSLGIGAGIESMLDIETITGVVRLAFFLSFFVSAFYSATVCSCFLLSPQCVYSSGDCCAVWQDVDDLLTPNTHHTSHITQHPTPNPNAHTHARTQRARNATRTHRTCSAGWERGS